MKPLFDATVPYMRAGKCYNYTLLMTDEPKQVMRFFVSNVEAHKTIGKGEIYNYSYWITTINEKSDITDCGMYVWNRIGDFGHSDWYGVRNAMIQEMSNDEAAEFVSHLKNKWAREIYLGC